MIFGVSDEVFLNSEKIKIIVGPAGTAKSSKTDGFFTGKGIPYLRLTSSNALKHDAQMRYPNTPCETIQTGLFNYDPKKCRFYTNPKADEDIPYDHIVIDEMPQTSERVLDWTLETDKNVIITCDIRQLLAPGSGDRIVKRMLALKDDPRVEWIELTKSLRPVTERTAEVYEKAYAMAEEDSTQLFGWAKNHLNVGAYEDFTFTADDIILTHTDAIEKFIYEQVLPREKGFTLIPKGTLARSKNPNPDKYPVIPQIVADKQKIRGYLQAKQICTPTRFQGSECRQGQRLFFVVEKFSRVSNREMYTVMTRCKDIDDLTILIVTLPDTEKINFFRGRPVKRHAFLSVDGEDIVLEGARRCGYVENAKIRDIVESHPSDHFVYDRDVIYYKGDMIMSKDRYKQSTKNAKKRTYTPMSLANKDEKMQYAFTREFYKALEAHEIDSVRYANVIRGDSGEYEYELDLYSAFPTIVANEEMPVAGKLIYTKNQPGYLDIYVCRKQGICYEGAIFTSAFKELIPDGEYICSVPCEKGLKMGKLLCEKAFRSVESKAELKQFHWGFYQKKFLRPVYRGREIVEYELNEAFNYEILMVAISSCLSHIIYTLRSTIGECKNVVDAVHFGPSIKYSEIPEYDDNVNYDEIMKAEEKRAQEQIEAGRKVMEEQFPNYNFRIRRQTPVFADGKMEYEKQTIYQTYQNLKTEQELKREYFRDIMRQRRAEGKAKDTRKHRVRRKAG